MNTEAARHLLLAVLAGAALAAGCAGNPATNSPTVVMSSRGGEAQLGAEMHQQMIDEGVAAGSARVPATATAGSGPPGTCRQTALRERVPNRMEGICGKCILKGVCLGACRADAFVLSGSLGTPFWICQEAYEKGLFPEQRMM